MFLMPNYFQAKYDQRKAEERMQSLPLTRSDAWRPKMQDASESVSNGVRYYNHHHHENNHYSKSPYTGGDNADTHLRIT